MVRSCFPLFLKPAIGPHLIAFSTFADRPITYLYNTLHFYERRLRERPPLKKLLVSAVIGSLTSIRPANWAITEQYQKYIETPDTEATAWQPELSYYIALMKRLVDSKLNAIHHPNTSQLKC